MTAHDPEWLREYRSGERALLPARPEASRQWAEVDDDPLVSDVAFNRHSMNDGEHVSPFDNGKVQVGKDGIEVVLAQGIDEAALRRTLSMATRATIGIDISDPSVMTDTGDSEEMFKGGLQTALETQTIVFAVKGVSRTCTHQLVRSRRAAFHQQSQRASYMGDQPECRMPESVWKNRRARDAFLDALMMSWHAYRVCCDEDISYQDARFALLEGTNNFIMLEYPIREFLNVYAYRACYMFQWEISHVMHLCREALIKAHPFMEPYVKISCEKTPPVTVALGYPDDPDGSVGGVRDVTLPHQCTFQGWEDVEGQCPFSWAKHEARVFKPAHHRISRAATPGGESSGGTASA